MTETSSAALALEQGKDDWPKASPAAQSRLGDTCQAEPGEAHARLGNVQSRH